MKKMIFAAVALGVVTSSAFATDIDPSSITTVPATVTVAAPANITASFKPIIIPSGPQAAWTDVGVLTVTSTDGSVVAAQGDVTAPDYSDQYNSWTTTGTNDTNHKIKLAVSTNDSISYGYHGTSHIWRLYSSGTPIKIQLASDQEVAADSYTFKLFAAKLLN